MLFDDFTQEEIAAVEELGKVRSFKADEFVCREGDTDRSLFVVKRGTLEIMKILSEDHCKHLRNLGEGDFFGEISFLGISPRTANVLAIEDSEVLELTHEKLEPLTRENKAVALKIYCNIARIIAVRLKETNEDLKKSLLCVIEGMDG